MKTNNNVYIGFDPKYRIYSAQKEYSGTMLDIRQLLAEDSDLEKLSLNDIYQEIDKRNDIYKLNISGLQDIDCKIGTRLFDFRYRPYTRERLSLEMEQLRLQQRILDERTGCFKDTLRLRELALKKKESIRSDESTTIDQLMEGGNEGGNAEGYRF